MIKIAPIVLLLVLELQIFYQVSPSYAYPPRRLKHPCMAYWYYTERKHAINLTDRLFLVSCLIPAITPFPIFIFGFTWGTLVEVIRLLVSYQWLIKIYLLEGAIIRLSSNFRTFTRVYMNPYEFDYGTVRIASTLSRILLITGLINRVSRESLQAD